MCPAFPCLNDAAVADRQLDRATSLAQLVSLSRSAGLVVPPGGVSTVARAELASVLTGPGADVLDRLRQFTLARLDDEPSTDRRVWTLLDAAAVLKALGAAEDAAWLLDSAEALTKPSAGGPPALEPIAAFELAEALYGLPTEDLAKRSRVAKGMTLTAARSMTAIRDLDAYEALPADLAQDAAVAALARERAKSVIEVEYERLLQTMDNARTIEVYARDLDERARSYELDIDIGPILARVDELAAEGTDSPDWPGAADEPHDGSDDADADLHQIFRQLGDDDTDADP
jgi:hypothetical protein